MPNTKYPKHLERAVDAVYRDEEDESRHDDSESEFYELRTCGNPDCEKPLPLDKPGHYVNIRGERTLVCPGCYEFMEIFGGMEPDDADY